MKTTRRDFLKLGATMAEVGKPRWLETVNVPYGGYVDVIMDCTNPVIRGVSLFHCYLLGHEEKE